MTNPVKLGGRDWTKTGPKLTTVEEDIKRQNAASQQGKVGRRVEQVYKTMLSTCDDLEKRINELENLFVILEGKYESSLVSPRKRKRKKSAKTVE